MKSKTPPSSAPRKAYRQPKLVRYGDVRLLTRSGSAATMESMAAPTGMSSSRAYKENIVKIGQHPRGFGLYLFDYRREFQPLYGSGRRFGVMAEEIEGIVPEAVSVNERGHIVVDYGRLGIRQGSA